MCSASRKTYQHRCGRCYLLSSPAPLHRHLQSLILTVAGGTERTDFALTFSVCILIYEFAVRLFSQEARSRTVDVSMLPWSFRRPTHSIRCSTVPGELRYTVTHSTILHLQRPLSCIWPQSWPHMLSFATALTAFGCASLISINLIKLLVLA
jgi:hypothetical protein